MTLNKFLATIVIFTSLFSCQKVLEINAEALPSEMVIDGRIETGQRPQIILRNSGFLYEPIDIEATYIHDAIVEISDGTNSTILSEKCFRIYTKTDSLLNNNDTLTQNQFNFLLITTTLEEMDSIYEHYYHISPEELEKSQVLCVYAISSNPFFVGEEGKTYTLTVTDGDKVVTASTTIPEQFAVDSLSFTKNPEDPNFSDVFIHLTFPTNNVLGHYIQYGSRTIGTSDFYGMRTGSVYSDSRFDGSSSLKLPLEGRKYRNEGRIASAERQFESGDTVTLIWKNIDKNSYDFIFTSENDGGASPFSSPTKILSNINGGLGKWSGYNISTESIYIP